MAEPDSQVPTLAGHARFALALRADGERHIDRVSVIVSVAEPPRRPIGGSIAEIPPETRLEFRHYALSVPVRFYGMQLELHASAQDTTPLNTTPLNTTPLNTTPLNTTPLNTTPMDATS